MKIFPARVLLTQRHEADNSELRAYTSRETRGSARESRGSAALSECNNNEENNAKQRLRGGITGKGFRPGQSGNPKGRPPTRRLVNALKAALGEVRKDGRTMEQAIAGELVREALRGRRKLAAIAEIFDRIEGKPRQQVDLNDITEEFSGRTDEELLYYAEHGNWPEQECDRDVQKPTVTDR